MPNSAEELQSGPLQYLKDRIHGLVLLLAGGDKSIQAADILKARALLKEMK